MNVRYHSYNLLNQLNLKRVYKLKGNVYDRCVLLADYIIETQSTVRAAAKKFNISKSTVHKDITERLCKINQATADEVKEVLEKNKAERHIRGGMATKEKYEKQKQVRTSRQNYYN